MPSSTHASSLLYSDYATIYTTKHGMIQSYKSFLSPSGIKHLEKQQILTGIARFIRNSADVIIMQNSPYSFVNIKLVDEKLMQVPLESVYRQK